MEFIDMNAPVNHPPLMLDPDVLRSFVAIAETGSFTAAAANRIYRTPSAVSMQIKRLEEQLGVSVFLRDARNVALTHDGEVLLELCAAADRAQSRSDFALRLDQRSPAWCGSVRRPTMARRCSRRFSSAVLALAPCGGGRRGDRPILKSAQAVQLGPSRHRADQLHAGNMKAEPEEVVMTDDIVWAGAKGGQACLMDPLPVSMWDEGCVWRESGAVSARQEWDAPTGSLS
jgi:DNA-binding MarR family transcriptional regulator